MEIWKDIPNYEGHYQVSNLGKVKSLKWGKEKILKQSVKGDGYLGVSLHRNNKQASVKVHIIIAIVFHGHKPDGRHNVVVDHDDNNKLNNRADNIKLRTNRENTSKDRKGGSSCFVGVSWRKANLKWESRIFVKGKKLHLGFFNCELAAHNAYQKKLQQLNTTI